MTATVRTDSVDATRRLAAALAPWLRPRDVIVLSGDLGGGKTAFVQGLAAALGVHEPVTSPTFTLVQSYRGRITLHHIDAYRLERSEEFVDLNLPELVEDDAVVAIEWGERLVDELLPDYLTITFRFGDADDSGDVRLVDIGAIGPSWESRVGEIVAAMRSAA